MAEKEMQSADVCTHKNKIKTSFAKIFVSGTPDRPCFSFCREGEPLSFLLYFFSFGRGCYMQHVSMLCVCNYTRESTGRGRESFHARGEK